MNRRGFFGTLGAVFVGVDLAKGPDRLLARYRPPFPCVCGRAPLVRFFRVVE